MHAHAVNPTYAHMYTHIYLSIYLSLSLSIYIYIYIYIHTHMERPTPIFDCLATQPARPFVPPGVGREEVRVVLK